MKKIVIYHKDCLDGFGGAWVAWKKFGDKAEYIGEKHGQPIEKDIKGKDVYFIDFSYPKPQIDEIKKDAASLTMIDHHISAKEIVLSAANHLYALDHSGATLAWQYFFPKKKTPKLLLHIEDVDLWRFKMKNTPEIIVSLGLYPFDFKVWNKLAKDMEDKDKYKKYLEDGKIILKYKKAIISKLVGKADDVILDGYKAKVVNSPIFGSEVGNQLIKAGAQIGIIYSEESGVKKVSLRSGSDKVDVSKVAGKYGGGGHKRASGFSIPRGKKEPWKIK